MPKPKKKKRSPKQQPIRKVGTPKNIVTIQPDPPRGSFQSEDACREGSKLLMDDLRAVFNKHQVAVTFCGALLPIAQWGEIADKDTGQLKKAWLLRNVMAACVTSSHADDVKPTLLGILNGLSVKNYGPPPGTPPPERNSKPE